MNYISIKLLRRKKGREERERKENRATEIPNKDYLPFQALPPQAQAVPGSKLQAPGSDLESRGHTHGQHLAEDHAWDGGVLPRPLWTRPGLLGPARPASQAVTVRG